MVKVDEIETQKQPKTTQKQRQCQIQSMIKVDESDEYPTTPPKKKKKSTKQNNKKTKKQDNGGNPRQKGNWRKLEKIGFNLCTGYSFQLVVFIPQGFLPAGFNEASNSCRRR